MTVTTHVEPSEFDFPLEEITPLDRGEGSLDLGPSFPPFDEPMSYLKSIDWADVRYRARRGVNRCGIVIAVIGEKIHDLGFWLACIGSEDI